MSEQFHLAGSIGSIPVAEFPGLEKVDELMRGMAALTERLDLLEAQVEDAKKTSATLLSGLLPGGIVHDRIAEARAALKELASDPSQPHHASAQALMRLNWGLMSVEE